ncbi:hypothetical protein TWF191_003038 [Orbilia oligospora]|uniref:Uncharacterized protein n=1 Tax=Orbilia oligospora TaxID=2813651 RepID=A0A7C8R0X2_ORBOL|nr:hypothetical protein TWF191_003038 [Orbilia oligospora]
MELYKSFLLFCFLALVALQQSVTALPIPRPRLFAPAPKLELSQRCPIRGSSELYGLGVRLGLYLQWLSTMLLRYRRSWGRKSTVRGITNLTCVSLFISLVSNLANGTSLSIDHLIVYYLTVVMFYAELYTCDRIFSEENVYVSAVDKAQLYREHGCKIIPVPGDLGIEEEKEMGLRLRADFPLVFQNGLSVAQSVLATWFWVTGLNSIPGFPCMTLEAAAILGVFPLRAHPWQQFATFAAVASSAFFSLLFYIHVQDVVRGYKSIPAATVVTLRIGEHRGSINPTRFSILKAVFRPEPPKLTAAAYDFNWAFGSLYQSVHYFLVYFSGPLVALLSVERIIANNGIKTTPILASTAQILVLSSGLLAVMITAWDVLAQKLRYEHGTNVLKRRARSGGPPFPVLRMQGV